MTATAKKVDTDKTVVVSKTNRKAPAFALRDGKLIALAGTSFGLDCATLAFADDTEIETGSIVPGADYLLVWVRSGLIKVMPHPIAEAGEVGVLGGFHVGLGGNAPARAGGDNVPAINQCSIWDQSFRPVADPCGMTYVAGVPGSEGVKPFWADIYLLGVDHVEQGTSCAGVTIADGARQKPKKATDGDRVDKLDYATAVSIMAGHGKQLMSFAEFAAAAYGVTEKTAVGTKPQLTGLDPARTSRVGLMQATGNIYVWGHDGVPDTPRASRFGGYWDDGDWAGSRDAYVGYWPGSSYEWIGARGRSDHLQRD